MKRMHIPKVLVLPLALLMGLLLPVALAAMGLLNLPPGDVYAMHGDWNQGTLGGTIDISLMEVPAGYDVTNGTYAGWCAEDNFQADQDGTMVTLIDSTEDTANLPSSYQPVPWDKVNYLLNHKAGSVQEVQAAIWLLTWGDSTSFPVTEAAQAMYDEAMTQGEGFMPGPGQVVAVLVYGDGLGWAGYQDTMIEVPLPVPESATIGDRVWYDNNGDGVQDAGEPGIPDVTVNLTDCAGGVMASDVTDADGLYLFDGLAAGTYCVVIDEATLPSDVQQTFEKDGTLDGDTQQPLNAGDEVLDVDFGYQPLGSIGDTVWYDNNGNGEQDAGEPGIPGVTVDLNEPGPDGVCGTEDDVFLASDLTDGNGNYLFTDLPEGSYCVDPDETTVPEGYELTTANDPETVDLGPGEDYLDADFGYQPLPATVGDRVWYDDDGDGVQDAGELGIPDVTVKLTDCAGGTMATDVTDADGLYLFEGLAAGTYCVVIDEATLPADVQQTFEKDGTLDGDTQQALNAGDEVLDVDFGYQPLGSIGDKVWEDTDGDGVQDEGEPGIPDVTVNLYDCSGAFVATTTTDAEGNYSFEGLAPGDYYVEFVAPGGYVFGPQDQSGDDALDSDADPATGQTDCTTLESGENDTTWDAGLIPSRCDLVVTKTCQIPVAPTSFVCSDAKPIDELTMIWNGTQTVNVVAWYGAVGSTVVGTVEAVAPGDVVAISGFAGSPNDVYWEILDAATGSKLGESVYHLSCSDDEMNGPEDCGLPEGDGKSNDTSLINDWLFEGMAGNGQALICTPTPPEPSDTCEIVAGSTPSCETEGNVYELTFRFIGGTCADSVNTQGDKFKCTDYAPIDVSLPIQVVYVGKDPDKFSVTPDVVSVGDEFSIDTTRSDFHSETKLEIWQAGELVQFLNVHTSCSAPLQVGDVFAGLELAALNGQRGGSEVTYAYQVTNLGTALTGVTLVDDPLGHIAGPFDLASGETRAFQTVAQIAESVTNVGTFSGYLAGGAICQASDTATVTVVEPCAECKGGTTELTFQYLGAQAANVVVYDDNDAKADKILFEGLLQPGDEFTITPRPGQDKLNNDISIWVDGVFNAKLHTSCSQPIGPGLIAGDFLIVEARSKDNGLMCPLNTCAPQAAPTFEFHDREIKWDITNTGDLGLEIERITITWPEANGALDEIKLDADTIHKGDFASPSAVIDSGWEGNADKRTIKPGETDTLKLKFKNNASMQGEYHIVVEFTYGCSIETEYVPGQEPEVLVCTSKVQAMSLSYTGPDLVGPTVVEVDPDKGATATYTLDGLTAGTVLMLAGHNDWTIDATVSGEVELGAKTKIRINGVEEVIHTSCSTPFVADAPAPLDNPKGDPSPHWFVESFSQK